VSKEQEKSIIIKTVSMEEKIKREIQNQYKTLKQVVYPFLIKF